MQHPYPIGTQIQDHCKPVVHCVTTETCFVSQTAEGEKECSTGNCGEYGNWALETRNEAQRIATALGGEVIEETPWGYHEWTTHDPSSKTITTHRNQNMLKLAVTVDGRIVARVYATKLIR